MRCPSCGARNIERGGWVPLAVASCTTCGDARQGFGEPDAPGSRRELAAGTAIAGSLRLPGLGHVLLGAVGPGVARILLWLLWAGAGIGSLTGRRFVVLVAAVTGGLLLTAMAAALRALG